MEENIRYDISIKNYRNQINHVVLVSNPDHFYPQYSQFFKRHPILSYKYGVRYQYRILPKENTKCRILGVYKHAEKNSYDSNNFVFILEQIESKRIYLSGENGFYLIK